MFTARRRWAWKEGLRKDGQALQTDLWQDGGDNHARTRAIIYYCGAGYRDRYASTASSSHRSFSACP